MLISVVIATYNSEATLGECLDSLVDQTFTDFEVIIKDGGSSDGTLDIVDKYKDTLKLKLITSEDTGVYNAWNVALTKVGGSWVTFLGSDDFLCYSDALRDISSEIDSITDFSKMLFGRNIIISQDGSTKTELGESWEISKNKLNRIMSVRHPGSFYHIDLINSVNGFDEKFKIIGDYDFVFKASSLTTARYYDYSIVKHRIGGLSINPLRCKNVIDETISFRRKHNLKPYVLVDSLFIKRWVLYLGSRFLGEKIVIKLLG